MYLLSNILKRQIMSVRKNILLLFDVDGTLTTPRHQISDDLERFLLGKVKPLVSIGLVGGSDFPKIVEQMKGESVIEKFDYVFAENGLVQYMHGQLVRKQSLLDEMGEETVQNFINFCLGYLSKIKLPAKRGNFIEFRSGMINVSPIGRSCSQSEREAFVVYDTEHKIREKFISEMQAAFPNSGLTFSIGGQISIDIFPTGWDKSFCLQHVLNDTQFPEIHFFGDKTYKGGNDHEIFIDARTIGHTVTSPDDTRKQIRELLNL